MIEPRRFSLDGSEWSCARVHDDGSPDAQACEILTCASLSARPQLIRNGIVEREWPDPLAALHWLQATVCDTRNATPWAGFLNFDLAALFEELPRCAVDDLRMPLFAFAPLRSSPAVEFPDRKRDADDAIAPTNITSTLLRQDFIRAVKRTLAYIRAGDVYQVNLAQRFTVPLRDDPFQIYRRLQARTPAGYGAFLDLGDFQILSNSPELFLRVEPRNDGSRRVITRPIKGTRPRMLGMEIELRDSVKDQAELNMIIDLERNDLGRVCEIGSVRVTEPRAIEAHPTVYHGVATIEGILRPDVTFVDLLRATFPSGSVTGAPKIRAMQIIDELEPVRRGPYCGAIGYIAPDGTIELNVAIRTMIIRGDQVYIPVGGGIVADSDPEAEYAETLVKSEAMFAALGIRSGSFA